MIQTLPARPILDAKVAAEIAGVSYEAARLAVLALEDAGVLEPMFVGRRRNRAWEAPEVVALLDNFGWELAGANGVSRAEESGSTPSSSVRAVGADSRE